MKLKLDKKMSKKMIAIALVGTMSASIITGCSKKENNEKSNISPTPTVTITPTPVFDNPNVSIPSEEEIDAILEILDNASSEKYGIEKQIYNKTNTNLKKLFSNLSEQTLKNTSLILLLDILAPEDENGKINADIISEFKSKIDTDNMMNDFNSFIDVLENTMISEGKFVSISENLPNEESDQKEILSNIENITKNIIELSKDSDNKEKINTEFDKIYTLFVEEDSIEIDGVKFEVRDLNYANRAIAQVYARVAAFYARGYVSEESLNAIDNRTNDQNNKAYIKTKLEILSNFMVEKSEADVDKLFEEEYNSLNDYNITLTSEQIEDTINYLNLEYLDSDKVSTNDKNFILDNYSDEEVKEVISSIDAIATYNINNQDNLIILSDLLVDNEYYKIDSIALDYIQFNSIMLLNTVNDNMSFTEIYNNPYFKNLYLFFTKQDFVHKTKTKDENVVWQEVSDGTKFVCNEIIVYTLNKLPQLENLSSYKEIANKNLTESIQYIQNTISGECEKVDSSDFVKIK